MITISTNKYDRLHFNHLPKRERKKENNLLEIFLSFKESRYKKQYYSIKFVYICIVMN